MQDGIYPSRNFATFGPSGLRPPFTGTYILSGNLKFLSCSTGQASDFIHHFTILQNLMFLLNSRHFLLISTIKYPFFLSYGANLPSSFNIITPFAFQFSNSLHVLELVRYKNTLFPELRYNHTYKMKVQLC